MKKKNFWKKRLYKSRFLIVALVGIFSIIPAKLGFDQIAVWTFLLVAIFLLVLTFFSIKTGDIYLSDNVILREKQPHLFWIAIIIWGLLSLSIILICILQLV